MRIECAEVGCSNGADITPIGSVLFYLGLPAGFEMRVYTYSDGTSDCFIYCREHLGIKRPSVDYRR